MHFKGVCSIIYMLIKGRENGKNKYKRINF